MADVNKRLREAAKDGDEFEVKALLQDPGCDALDKNENSVTALMWAARKGHEACVRILLPVSDALATDEAGMTALMCAAYVGHEGCVGLLLPVSEVLAMANNGLTASGWARSCSHGRVVQFIEAYALAQSEQNAIEVAVFTFSSRRRAVIRV